MAGLCLHGEEPILEPLFWQDVWTPGGPILEASLPESLHSVDRTRSEAVGEELQPLERTFVGEILAGLSPMGRTTGRSRERS